MKRTPAAPGAFIDLPADQWDRLPDDAEPQERPAAMSRRKRWLFKLFVVAILAAVKTADVADHRYHFGPLPDPTINCKPGLSYLC